METPEEIRAAIGRLKSMNQTAQGHLASLRNKRPGIVSAGSLGRLRQLDASIAEYQAEIHERNKRIAKLEAKL
jgi:hypothetical protein